LGNDIIRLKDSFCKWIVLALRIWNVFRKRLAYEGTLKFIWDSKHGKSIWLVIKSRINFIFNSLRRSARVGSSSWLVTFVLLWDKWGIPNTKQVNLKNLCWTRFRWSELETVYGYQITNRYSKIERTKVQYIKILAI